MEVEAYVAGMQHGASIVSSLIGAAPGGVWRCRFVARVQTPEGGYEAMTADFIKLNSGPIEQLSSREREDAQEKLNWIHDNAVAHGFEPIPRGTYWYSYRYQRPYDPQSSPASTGGRSTEDLLREASALRGAGRHSEAVENLTAALALDPNCRRAYFMRADSLRMSGKPKEALKDCQEALSRNRTGFDASEGLLLRAETYEMLGNWSAALEDSHKVVAHRLSDQGKHMLWATMGHCYFEMRDYKSSISYFSKAVKAAPDEFSTRINRATAYTQMREYGKAVRDCEYVVSREPGNETAQRKLKYLRSKTT
ncbi:tetratricopeptide repeat protein [Streptomyces sp. PKU-EA00015]|uniref:tetratricopeptide repeat protein n=1 Tax=Streptomyces sp. PKU-EA00015 TaxID=2748326 RepID=UPI00210F0DCB|nr:tetratricopeptide repeat protein [Streptomyces sp. PKU-EA00015]